MSTTTTALRTALAAGLLVVLLACSPTEGRGQQRIVGWSAADDVLLLVVDTCNGDPEATVVETDADVTVTVVSTRRNPGDACQDVVEVVLDAPLGDRTLVDGWTGEEPEPIEG